MSRLKELLKQKVNEINKDAARMQKVKEWIIDGYYGKIINFRSLDTRESYHVVVTRDKLEPRVGDYPSCEFSYQANEETLLNILNKKADASSTVKAGRMEVRGSLNEAIKFEKLL